MDQLLSHGWMVALVATSVVILLIPEARALLKRVNGVKVLGWELSFGTADAASTQQEVGAWGRYAVLRFAVAIFIATTPFIANFIIAETRSTAEKLSALDSMRIPAFVVEVPVLNRVLDEKDVALLRILEANRAATEFYNQKVQDGTTLGQLIQSRRGARIESKSVRDAFQQLMTSELRERVNERPAEIRLTCKFVTAGEGFSITQIVGHQLTRTPDSCTYLVAVLEVQDKRVLASDQLAEWAQNAQIRVQATTEPK